MSTVREAGRYAYRGDTAMCARFASAYRRRKHRRAKKSAATPVQPAEPVANPGALALLDRSVTVPDTRANERYSARSIW